MVRQGIGSQILGRSEADAYPLIAGLSSEFVSMNTVLSLWSIRPARARSTLRFESIWRNRDPLSSTTSAPCSPQSAHRGVNVTT
jgi:hypothetical protein